MRDPNKKWGNSRFTDGELETMTDDEFYEKEPTHDEYMRRAAVKSPNYHKTVKEALNETPQGRNKVREIERQESCPWCHADAEGKYSSARFTKADGTSSLFIFYSGAQATVRFTESGKPDLTLNHPIYYCPMCGRHTRKFEDDEYPEDDDE